MVLEVEVLTYGALNICSSTTHMPRSNSVIRKYLPALSSALSLSVSHRAGLAIRKPAGGGPAGSAARRKLVEKAAAWEWCGPMEGRRRLNAAGRVRANACSGLMLAIGGYESTGCARGDSLEVVPTMLICFCWLKTLRKSTVAIEFNKSFTCNASPPLFELDRAM